MTRLIDADALEYVYEASFVNGHFVHGAELILKTDIDSAPTLCCETCGTSKGNGGDCSGTFWREKKRPEQSGGTGCSAREAKPGWR